MDKFIVSARKYRPVTFDTVVGQPGITNTLKNAIRNNHLAQAFLFTGPRGVGKTTTARILAKTINCKNITPSVEACDVCTSCTSFNSGQSLNIYELDAASNNSVDDIRALVDQVRYAPQMGKYKVYIIDEVHMLSASAFNAFLKTLEEPPSYAIFILATTEKHKIIPTILSRCQIFDFNRIGVEDIVSHLKEIAGKEKVEAEEDALHIIAQKADGALRDALSLFDQLVSFAGSKLTYRNVIDNLNILDYDYYFRITDEILAGNIPAVLLTYNEILNNGFDSHNFINGLASHFRDLLVCRDEITLSLLEVSPNVKEKYKVQSKFCDSNWLLEQIDLCYKADVSYKSAKNQRLLIELSLMKMCRSTEAGGKKKSESTPIAQPAQNVNGHSQPAIAGSTTAPNVTPAPAVQGEGVISKAPSPAAPPPSPVQSSPTTGAGTRTKPVSSRKSFSISSKLNETGRPAEVLTEEDKPTGDAKFSAEQMLATWDQYAEMLLKGGRVALHTALTTTRPVLDADGITINFSVGSAAIEKDLKDIRTELLAYIRSRLNNYNIALALSIDKEAAQSSVPYTPSEKFKRLAEKNPAMNILRQKFDLEIEY